MNIHHHKVVWLEGMFLQAQHFQQQDRYHEHLLHQHTQEKQANQWGFLELELDQELLRLNQLGIHKARGFFQDGTFFDIPQQTPAPAPIEIKPEHSNTLFSLSLAKSVNTQKETGSNSEHGHYRYHAQLVEIEDSTAENQQTADVSLGQLHCQILPNTAEQTHHHHLAIAHIEEVRQNQTICFEQSFIPSFMNVHQAPALDTFVREVHTLLNQRAQMLSSRLSDTQQAGTAEISDFMLLQMVNRYEPLFAYLCHQSPLHPESLYMTLLQLMGEMATFTNDKRRPSEVDTYNHNDLFKTFKPIIKQLRHSLSIVLEQHASAIALEDRGHGLWLGQIHDKSLLENCRFVLAVYAEVPIDQVKQRFASQIKIAPAEQIQTLVSKGLAGVGIQPMAIAPRQIPHHANFAYFAISHQEPRWQSLQSSAAIALHVSGQMPGLKLELWAIKE